MSTATLEAPASAPIAPADDGERYVVLHTRIGELTRGRVVTAQKLGGSENVPRLLSLKAIRLATVEEAVQEKVTIRDTDRHESYETMLVDKNREIELLKMDGNLLREEVRRLKSATAPAYTPTHQPIDHRASAEKDRVIEQLTQQVKDLQAARSTPAANANRKG